VEAPGRRRTKVGWPGGIAPPGSRRSSTRTTEIVYRRELRPVITTGAEIMDELFSGT
jgi:hypothetical protein